MEERRCKAELDLWKKRKKKEKVMAMPGYQLKLHFQIPCVFPVRLQIFPVSIYVIYDYYTKLAWQIYPAGFFFLIFAANIKISFTFNNQGINILSKPNSLCFDKISEFPDRDFFLPFSLFFPVQWVPCNAASPESSLSQTQTSLSLSQPGANVNFTG